MLPAQSAITKKPGSGHLRQGQAMKLKQDLFVAQSARIHGENIDNFLVNIIKQIKN